MVLSVTPILGDLDGLPASTGLVSAPTLRKASSASLGVAYRNTRARLLARHSPTDLQEKTIDNRNGARGSSDFSSGFLSLLCQSHRWHPVVDLRKKDASLLADVRLFHRCRSRRLSRKDYFRFNCFANFM